MRSERTFRSASSENIQCPSGWRSFGTPRGAPKFLVFHARRAGKIEGFILRKKAMTYPSMNQPLHLKIDVLHQKLLFLPGSASLPVVSSLALAIVG